MDVPLFLLSLAGAPVMQSKSINLSVSATAMPATEDCAAATDCVANDSAPLRAAGGDDSVMSQPPPPASADAELARTRWQGSISAAHGVWSRLTEDELLQTQGDPQQLADRVADCYAISPAEARLQVESFLAGRPS